MNFDQRSDEQPIRSGELPVVAGASEDDGHLPPNDEFEEAPFSKGSLPASPFVGRIFTSTWAGGL